MKPALNPGLVAVWRNRDTLQIGIDPRRAVALTGMREAAPLLGLLDGSRDHAQVLAAARELGIGQAAADRVISLLAAGGVLQDFPASTYQALPAAARSRLAPELATAAIAHGDSDGGARTLARRQAAWVRVHGGCAAGLRTAALLSSAGVGLVVSTGLTPPGLPSHEEAPAMPGRAAAPGGIVDRVGEGGARSAEGPGPSAAQPHPGRPARAIRPARRARTGRRPDLVVLADTHDRELPAALLRDGIPHLAASASEAIGVVGPLVVPGHSACLRCLDMARADRDPAWPVILAQLSHRAADPSACDTVLASAVATVAAAQVLAFLERGAAATAVADGTLELVLPGWQWHRRSWRAHHRCDCRTRGTK